MLSLMQHLTHLGWSLAQGMSVPGSSMLTSYLPHAGHILISSELSQERSVSGGAPK